MPIHSQMSVHASLVDYNRLMQLWIFQRGETIDSVVRPVILELQTRAHMSNDVCEPTMTMHYNFAQKLLDSMIEAGMKPSNQGNAGHLGALRDHLSDMRRLVFDK